MNVSDKPVMLDPFPPLEKASSDGLLAMGGDLSAHRLIHAYSQGIFPWFEEGQPILWWSPDPRCVLYPDEFKTSGSLKKSIRKHNFVATVDRQFEAVIQACAGPRGAQRGTWITPEMHQAYCELYALGDAHSVEVWQDGTLVGGLYGVSLGKIFYGESMFSLVSDASKFALKYLCEMLEKNNYALIDCQVESAHLLSLGACVVPRTQFIQEMTNALKINQMHDEWAMMGGNVSA